jgi:hypothetical protein
MNTETPCEQDTRRLQQSLQASTIAAADFEISLKNFGWLPRLPESSRRVVRYTGNAS